ncbi:hypothetical protein Rhow_004560 [Rhodococcus wratislaviensis]|uniref:Uncharacterized protein n=1 Tax=Rhodococcus wratislaviensis TaxID=44752 RepID=A0A402CBQ8_RHOWR|nr:hypothetical protein Rhow_004560 [Rhodococcus wratislaviensis]
MLNGADGLGEIATGLVGQGLAIFESLRAGVGQQQPSGQVPGSSTDRAQLNPRSE